MKKVGKILVVLILVILVITAIQKEIPFRSLLVRLINQVDYYLFRTTNDEGVVVGKNDYLFEYDCIRSYNSVDFIGEEIIGCKIRKLRFLQHYLKSEKNIDLILVFEPGKSYYYPEYIPGKYLKDMPQQTNYTSIVGIAKGYNLRHIDFNAYFSQLKEQSEYPLYSQYGTRWSAWGMSRVADSLIRHIETLRQINLPDVYIDSIKVTTTPDKADYDLASNLNLLYPLPERERLAYPFYRFEENPEKDRPMVLVIADHYYWNIFNSGIPKNVFKNQAYWYNYDKVFPESFTHETPVENLNLKEEIEKQDVILLMVTGLFLHKLGWGFIEDAYSLYAPQSRFDSLHNYKCEILNYCTSFDSEIEKARVRDITLEENLNLSAEYLYSQKDLNGLLLLKGPAYFENQMRNDPIWMREIKRKADEKRKVLLEIMREDAVYMFTTYHPETYQKYLRLMAIKETIMGDSVLVNKTSQLAARYILTFEEALQLNAERIFDNKNPL
jgi:hypothetical protein